MGRRKKKVIQNENFSTGYDGVEREYNAAALGGIFDDAVENDGINNNIEKGKDFQVAEQKTNVLLEEHQREQQSFKDQDEQAFELEESGRDKTSSGATTKRKHIRFDEKGLEQESKPQQYNDDGNVPNAASSKKICLRTTTTTDIVNEEVYLFRDSYDDVYHQGQLLHKNGTLRQTWMDEYNTKERLSQNNRTNVHGDGTSAIRWWVNPRGSDMKHHSQHDVSHNKIEKDKLEMDTSTSSKDERYTAVQGSDNVSTSNEFLETMHNELNMLKQWLMPTAEECAQTASKMISSKSNVNISTVTSSSSSSTPSAYDYFEQARRQCNPFECLGEGQYRKGNKQERKSGEGGGGQQGLNHKLFVNRSAMKLVNIDAMLHFSLLTTSLARDNDNKSERDPSNSTFLFCDLCGAPGGFSEYLFYRAVNRENICSDNRSKKKRKRQKKKQHTEESQSDENDNETKAQQRQNNLQRIVGYGMSLKGTNDNGRGTKWRMAHLADFYDSGTKSGDGGRRRKETASNAGIDVSSNASTTEAITLLPKCEFHVCHGQDETGDIYNWDNIVYLKQTILKNEKEINSSSNNVKEAENTKEENLTTNVNGTEHPTDNEEKQHVDSHTERENVREGAVHLVVADGGFDAQRNHEDQERITYDLVVSQIASGLYLLNVGGTLIVKIFGTRTSLVRNMLCDVATRFQTISIVKPIVSRPASAERYLICRNYYGFRNDKDGDNNLLNQSDHIKHWRDQWIDKGVKATTFMDRPTATEAKGKTSVTHMRSPSPVVSTFDTDTHDSLQNYLMENERAMLSLNISACQAILSTMKQPDFIVDVLMSFHDDVVVPNAHSIKVQNIMSSPFLQSNEDFNIKDSCDSEQLAYRIKTKTLIKKYRQGWKLTATLM